MDFLSEACKAVGECRMSALSSSSKLSSRESVHLAAWGSHENSGAPEELQICLDSRSPSGSPEAAHSTSRSSASSGVLPGHKPGLDIQGLQTAAAHGMDQAEVLPVRYPRLQPGACRSMPGAPDPIDPQEVTVKVQVQPQGGAAGTKSGNKLQPQPQQQQQRYLQHPKAQHLQQQQHNQQQHNQQQQQRAALSRNLYQAEFLQSSSLCAELESQLSKDVAQQPQAAAADSSRSNTSVSSRDSPRLPPVKRSIVPLLDLSRAQLRKDAAAVKAVSEPQALTHEQAQRDEELCLDHSSCRTLTLHPNAPMQDNRCYHYKAVAPKDNAAVQELLARLVPTDAEQVAEMWDALLTARRDCEAMAARGVRISRDISRDWQETVSDLIDRVVAQDSELGQLRLQLKQAQQSAAASSASAAASAAQPMGSASQLCVSGSRTSNAAGSNIEDLHSQVVRLKRHRDRLMRDQQELSRELAETRAELHGTQLKAAEAQDQMMFLQQQAQDLRDQHVSLLQQHIELAAYAEGLEAAAACIPHQHPSYLLTTCGAHPSSIGPAVLTPAGYSPAQAHSIGWMVPADGQEHHAADMPSRTASGHLVYTMRQPILAHHQQIAWVGKDGRVQPLPGAQRAPERPQPLAADASAKPSARATAAAAAAGTAATGACMLGVPVTTAHTGWFQSSLASLAHFGRGQSNSRRSGTNAARAAAQAGAAPPRAPAELAAAAATGSMQGYDTLVSTAAGSVTAKAPCTAPTPADTVTPQSESLSGSHAQAVGLAYHLRSDRGPTPACGSDDAVRRTLEQAAAIVAAGAAAAAAGPAEAYTKASRRAPVPCPGRAAVSEEGLKFGGPRLQPAAASETDAEALQEDAGYL